MPVPARRSVLLGLTLSLFLPTALPAPAQEVTVGVRNGVVRSTVQGEVLHQLFLESRPVRERMQTGFQVAGFGRSPLTGRIGPARTAHGAGSIVFRSQGGFGRSRAAREGNPTTGVSHRKIGRVAKRSSALSTVF